MSRRAGKAASRKARQRRVHRPAVTPPPVSAPAAEPTVAASVEPAARSRPVVAATASGGAGSRLTASERSEYHYVERDLRDIGILTVVMAALLLLAWFVFGALGLAG